MPWYTYRHSFFKAKETGSETLSNSSRPYVQETTELEFKTGSSDPSIWRNQYMRTCVHKGMKVQACVYLTVSL